MADSSYPPHSETLAPPRKSVELVDPGAHELESSENEDDVFSDAPEGPKSITGANSPVPTTRVEKVDDRDSYGEVPGTEAYEMRLQDAVPDDVEVVKEAETSRPPSRSSQPDRTSTPGGTPIPRTVVEKIDPTAPSHGEVPGTTAYSMRQADAVPDEILKSPPLGGSFDNQSEDKGIKAETPIPTTVVTKIDEQPSHGEVPGTEAYEIRQGDAKPDLVETKDDGRGLPTSSMHRSSLYSPKPRPSAVRRDSPIAADGGFGPMTYDESENDPGEQPAEPPETDIVKDTEAADETFGDDFDDFEVEAAGEEEFGDFDEADTEPPKSELPSVSKSPFPIPDFSVHTSLSDILEATSMHLDIMFPSTANHPTEPPKQPSNPPESLFLTPRSHSLFTQLIAPPPLSPPNWLRSRTRRLFLVSLGVPIDLDEILPASKQKKLILPSTIRADSRSSRRSGSRRRDHGGLKGPHSGSSTSLSKESTKDRRRPKKGGGGTSPPPSFDLPQIRMLCSTTGAALKNMTDEEIGAHTAELQRLTKVAGEVLEYWVKRRDAAVREKEMFESVVGDLVKHARRVRK
ncbi:MAG: hypothetical protein Q9190_002227 [Brigantiaea leucoxantha]